MKRKKVGMLVFFFIFLTACSQNEAVVFDSVNAFYEDGLGITTSDGLDSYNQMKAVRLTEIKNEIIANELLNFDNIEDAKVLLSSAEDTVTAEVALTVTENITNGDIEKVALFISKCVNNLDSENIHITDQSGSVLFPN